MLKEGVCHQEKYSKGCSSGNCPCI